MYNLCAWCYLILIFSTACHNWFCSFITIPRMPHKVLAILDCLKLWIYNIGKLLSQKRSLFIPCIGMDILLFHWLTIFLWCSRFLEGHFGSQPVTLWNDITNLVPRFPVAISVYLLRLLSALFLNFSMTLVEWFLVIMPSLICQLQWNPCREGCLRLMMLTLRRWMRVVRTEIPLLIGWETLFQLFEQWKWKFIELPVLWTQTVKRQSWKRRLRGWHR